MRVLAVVLTKLKHLLTSFVTLCVTYCVMFVQSFAYTEGVNAEFWQKSLLFDQFITTEITWLSSYVRG